MGMHVLKKYTPKLIVPYELIVAQHLQSSKTAPLFPTYILELATSAVYIHAGMIWQSSSVWTIFSKPSLLMAL